MRRAGQIVTKWNSFSGQCNTTLARFLFRIGFSIAGVVAIFSAVTNKHTPTTWTWTGWLFIFACYTYIWIDTHKDFKKIEEGLDKVDEVLTCHLDPTTFNKLIWRARWFTGISIFFILINISLLDISSAISDIALFLMGFSIYIGLFITPMKKDYALARAKKKVIQALSSAKDKAKDLVPTPLPTPVAVRI